VRLDSNPLEPKSYLATSLATDRKVIYEHNPPRMSSKGDIYFHQALRHVLRGVVTATEYASDYCHDQWVDKHAEIYTRYKRRNLKPPTMTRLVLENRDLTRLAARYAAMTSVGILL
jgi:hypothetical protein